MDAECETIRGRGCEEETAIGKGSSLVSLDASWSRFWSCDGGESVVARGGELRCCRRGSS